MTESYSKEHDLKLKSINSVLTQYKEILSETVAPIAETIQASISSTLQALIDKIDEIQQMYQPVIDSAVPHIEEFIPKFDSLLLNLSDSMERIDFEECSDKDKENLQTCTTQLNEIEQTIHTPDKKFTREDLYALIQIIIAIFAIFQAHLYQQQNNESDEKFQTAVIELLQEIADNSNEPLEVHHRITGNIQIQVDEIP